MKPLLLTTLLVLAASFAKAEDTLLHCKIADSDIKEVLITESEDGLFLHQVSKKGTHAVSDLSEKQWNNRHIRLANHPKGFRYLTYTNGFDGMDWYVTVNGPGFQSIGRGNCQ